MQFPRTAFSNQFRSQLCLLDATNSSDLRLAMGEYTSPTLMELYMVLGIRPDDLFSDLSCHLLCLSLLYLSLPRQFLIYLPLLACYYSILTQLASLQIVFHLARSLLSQLQTSTATLTLLIRGRSGQTTNALFESCYGSN